MEYFLRAVKEHYADFNGRDTRRQYWMFFLFYFILYIALAIIDAVVGTMVLALIFSLAMLVPSLAAAARRLHDTGRSGWWQLILLIPLIGLIVLIVFLAQEGGAGDNQYGSDPRAAAPAV